MQHVKAEPGSEKAEPGVENIDADLRAPSLY